MNKLFIGRASATSTELRNAKGRILMEWFNNLFQNVIVRDDNMNMVIEHVKCKIEELDRKWPRMKSLDVYYDKTMKFIFVKWISKTDYDYCFRAPLHEVKATIVNGKYIKE